MTGETDSLQSASENGWISGTARKFPLSSLMQLLRNASSGNFDNRQPPISWLSIKPIIQPEISPLQLPHGISPDLSGEVNARNNHDLAT